MTDDAKLIKWWEDEIHLAEYVDSDYRDGIDVDVIKQTLDLISRQKAEIEMLKSDNDILSKNLHNLCKELEAEKIRNF